MGAVQVHQKMNLQAGKRVYGEWCFLLRLLERLELVALEVIFSFSGEEDEKLSVL